MTNMLAIILLTGIIKISSHFKLRDVGDACAGDSGGAYVMSDGTRWFQTGIVSHGAGCDKRKFYGIYTHVGKYYDWIKVKTEFHKEEVDEFLGNN